MWNIKRIVLTTNEDDDNDDVVGWHGANGWDPNGSINVSKSFQ